MPTVEQSIQVNVDVTTAYDQWNRFDSFPQWMEGVASVEPIDDSRLHWVAKVRSEFATVEGQTREWDARITEQTRDKRVSWETLGGTPGQKPDSGSAAFEPLGESSCRVTFTMTWEPNGAREPVTRSRPPLPLRTSTSLRPGSRRRLNRGALSLPRRRRPPAGACRRRRGSSYS